MAWCFRSEEPCTSDRRSRRPARYQGHRPVSATRELSQPRNTSEKCGHTWGVNRCGLIIYSSYSTPWCNSTPGQTSVR
eukprot:6786318-Heterocapsa_arctica.AAC.1